MAISEYFDTDEDFHEFLQQYEFTTDFTAEYMLNEALFGCIAGTHTSMDQDWLAFLEVHHPYTGELVDHEVYLDVKTAQDGNSATIKIRLPEEFGGGHYKAFKITIEEV